MSQSLNFLDFTKTQKSRYLENKTFFLQIKKFINCTSRATLWKKYFCSGGNFKKSLFSGIDPGEHFNKIAK